MFFGLRFLKMISRIPFMKEELDPKVPFERIFKIYLRDIDINNHLTNSKYPKFIDVVRVEFLIQSGFARALRAAKLKPLLHDTFIRFRRELRRGAVVTLKQEIVYIDSSWIYFDYKFINDGFIHSHALQKFGVYEPGVGMYPPNKLLPSLPVFDEKDMPDYVRAYNKLEEEFKAEARK
jgi:acyl-CoA thioesterase FadM